MGSVWLAGRMEPWTILLGGVLLLGAGYRLHRRSQTRRDRTVVRSAPLHATTSRLAAGGVGHVDPRPFPLG